MGEFGGIEERPEVDLSLFNLYDPVDQEMAREYLQRRNQEFEEISSADLDVSPYDLDGVNSVTYKRKTKRRRRHI